MKFKKGRKGMKSLLQVNHSWAQKVIQGHSPSKLEDRGEVKGNLKGLKRIYASIHSQKESLHGNDQYCDPSL